MTLLEAQRFNTLYQALATIASCDTPAYLQRHREKDYGLEYDEALEMAYENVRDMASDAIRKIKPVDVTKLISGNDTNNRK